MRAFRLSCCAVSLKAFAQPLGMPIPKSSWKGYAAGAIVVWAVGLQVLNDLQHEPYTYACDPKQLDRVLLASLTLLRIPAFVVQVSMWSLQKKPEFKQKFPELVEEPQQPEVSPCHAIDVVYQTSMLTPVLTG